jgi:sulfur-carrier protein
MIQVRLFAGLRAARSAAAEAGAKILIEVGAQPGLRVRDVVQQQGISPDAIQIILINGKRGTLDSPLADGDRLSLFPQLGGG